MVGIPVLANQRLPEGAIAFGLLMSAFAGGNLGGYLVAGSRSRPNESILKWLVISLIAAFGLVIGAMGFIYSTRVDFGLLLLLGFGNGYFAIILITWMQTCTPKEMLGRLMALVMLAGTGLAPISQVIAGVIIKWDLTLLFVIPGGLVLLVTVWMASNPDFKGFTEALQKQDRKAESSQVFNSPGSKSQEIPSRPSIHLSIGSPRHFHRTGLPWEMHSGRLS